MMRDDAHVLSVLVGLGLEISLGKALSSVTAVLRSSKPGAAVPHRVDMDAYLSSKRQTALWD